MFIIAKKSDFDKDFDDYLNHRINKGSNNNFFFRTVDSLIPKKTKNKDVLNEKDSDEMIQYKNKKDAGFLSKIFKRFYSKNKNEFDDDIDNLDSDIKEEVEEIEEEVEEIDEVVEELEDKRDSLLRRMFKRLFGIRDYDVEDEEGNIDADVVNQTIKNSQEELKEDTRIVLKSLHKWLSKLPPEHIESFRRSPDFMRYKELLEKYDLIKRD